MAAATVLVILLIAQYLVSFSSLPDWDDFKDDSATSTTSYPTVAYITYGYLESGHEWRFRKMVLDALDTWLASDFKSRIFYVVNEMWRENYDKVCDEVKSNRGKNCDRVVPIFVDCEEDYYGKSPCCKMDKGLQRMYQNYPHFDFYVYHDDDMYFRTDYMQDFLSGVPRDKVFVSSHHDMIPLGITFNDEKHQHCSEDKDFIYSWGQPVVYSNAGLRFMVDHVFQYDGVTEQCTVFDVTHDVGNAIVHWMSMMPLLRLPPVEITTSKNEEYGEDLVAFHAVGKDDKTNYNATGLHEVVRRMGYKRGPYEYVWHEPRGYKTTSTYHRYGAVDNWTEWHSMPVSDCKGPKYSYRRKAKRKPPENNKAGYS